MSLKVCETFVSIQGESSYAGLPCFFVRLTGCNLRCNYCDTAYAYTDGHDMDIEDILTEVRDSGVELVEVTGGEPLMQAETIPLIKGLCDEGYSVLVETNGSMEIEGIDSRAVVILDIKTPGSGMTEEMYYETLKKLRPRDEIKFVITDRADYDWTKDVIERFGLIGRNILFSPAFGLLSAEELTEWIIKDHLNVRLNIQLHKYIFKNSAHR